MNKNLGYAVLWLVLWLLLSVVVFLIPTAKTGTFWISYVFMTVAFMVQIWIWTKVFGRQDTIKSKFFGLPVVYISTVYLLVQIITFSVFTVLPTLPSWSAIVSCAVIFGISVLCMIAGEAGRNEIERVETKVQKKVFFIKEVQANIELLVDEELDVEIKTALQQLAEKIRFSDPMSNEALAEIDEAITTKIAEFKTVSDKVAVIQELNSLVTERNKKTIILK